MNDVIETIFPGPMGVPWAILDRIDEVAANRIQVDERIALKTAAVAVGAAEHEWGVPLSEDVRRWLQSVVRSHIAWSLSWSALARPRPRKSDPALKTQLGEQKRRQAQAADHLNKFVALLAEDREIGPWHSSITSTLDRPDLDTALTAIRILISGVRAQLTARKPNRTAGRRPHPTWDGMIKEFAAAYGAATGGAPRQRRFLRGLYALNAVLPSVRWGALPSDEAIQKRVREMFPCSHQNRRNSTRTGRNAC